MTLLLLALARGEIVKAFSSQDVNDLLTTHKGQTIALFFVNPHVDSTPESDQKQSFWDSILGIMDSIKGIFSSKQMDSSEIAS